jgi:hypothetical protein
VIGCCVRRTGKRVQMRIRKGIWYRNDDCDGEKYIGIECYCFFGFIDVFL